VLTVILLYTDVNVLITSIFTENNQHIQN
jgi:hypothetical protein